MKESVIKVEQLSHRYTRAWAIRDIDFQINHTGVVGLLGSNGAGKSTTMNIMCGVLNQTQGKIFINGIDLRKKPEEAKKQIGFLPQTAPLLMDLTVDEYLTHAAYLRSVDEKKIPEAVNIAKEKCGVSHFGKRLISNLSGGYRQRVGIAQAIIHNPLLVILDEPTNGLDPNQIVEVRKLIKEIGRESLVFFSSHILSEIQASCNYVMMIENGRLVFSDTIDAFENYMAPSTLLVSLDILPSENELLSIPGVTAIEVVNPKKVRLRIGNSQNINQKVIAASIQNGWGLNEIAFEKNSGDEIFARLSKSNTH